MERAFPREIGALEAVFSFLDGFSDDHNIPPAVRFPVNMAVEELFTNMVKYNASGDSDISIELMRTEEGFQVTLTDDDSQPFDVTQNRGVDTTAPLEERQPGGLGLHLVQRMMDELFYEFRNRRTRIRLVKHIG
jgi:anti-sigma regulatory factor (Ser/Thr protein kinase)